MLLYPVVEKSVRETCEMHGRTIEICTVDLSQSWQDIRAELMELVA